MDTWTYEHMDTCRKGDMDSWRHGHLDMDMETSNAKRKIKPRQFSFISSPFAHDANLSLLFVHEETNRSYPFANRLNGLNRLDHLLYAN